MYKRTDYCLFYLCGVIVPLMSYVAVIQLDSSVLRVKNSISRLTSAVAAEVTIRFRTASLLEVRVHYSTT